MVALELMVFRFCHTEKASPCNDAVVGWRDLQKYFREPLTH